MAEITGLLGQDTVTGLVEHEGAVLSYRAEGPKDGPVLVLANSLGTTTALWDPQLRGLVEHFRVLRYDHRGHGGSSVPPGPYSIAQLGGDLVAILDALSVKRASICGISLGGMVAMWMGAHVPERVDRLVLVSTAPVLGPPSSWDERALIVRESGTSPLLESILSRWFPPLFESEHRDGVARVAEMITACEPEGYAACCEAIGAMDLRPTLARIVAPTLVVQGAQDPVTPPSAGLALAEAVDGATFCVLPDAAHLVNLAQPERFVALVVEHLVGTASARGMAVRRAVLGDAHVEHAIASTSAFNAPFQDLITRYAWGEIWSRPALDRRTRSAVTLAMLITLGRMDELELHLRAAIGNGLRAEEIREVLLQSAVYAGAPAARSAFAVAEEILDMDL